MAAKSLFNGVKPTTTAETTIYTAGSSVIGTLLLKFVASNDTGTAATYTVRIYSESGTPDHIQPVTVVNRYKVHVPPALPGVVIPANGRLTVQVNPANSISFTGAGES